MRTLVLEGRRSPGVIPDIAYTTACLHRISHDVSFTSQLAQIKLLGTATVLTGKSNNLSWFSVPIAFSVDTWPVNVQAEPHPLPARTSCNGVYQ